jgi:3-phenylpropionate/trans-cinnamate dioxygenase ferredoxin reductase component
MLEAGETPFATVLGSAIGALLADRYRGHGIDLRTEAPAAGFRANESGRVCGIELADRSVVPCDVVLVAVGVEPERTLGVAASDLQFQFAGDAAGGPGHWTSAAADGVAAARRILGLDPLPAEAPFFWSDQFGLRIQLVGDAPAATAVEIDGRDSEFVARYWSTDGRLVAALAANRPREVAALRAELALAA